MSTSPSQEVTIQNWDEIIQHIQYLCSKTLQHNDQLKRRAATLENEVLTWHNAHANLQDDIDRRAAVYEAQLCALRKQISALRLKSLGPQTPFILCILDGNYFIFHQEYLTQGQMGGQRAASLLTRAIADFLSSRGLQDFKNLSFRITIYHCRDSLRASAIQQSLCSKEQFDSFFDGFSQASPCFSVVDVGDGLSHASAKLAEQLTTFTRFPQTMHVFLGVERHEYYAKILEAIDNEQLLGKIVFLKDQNSSDPRYADVQTLHIDRLFHSHESSASIKPAALTLTLRSSLSNGLMSPESPESISARNGHIPKVIDSKLPLHKQVPPPCNEFYLMTCTKGVSCKYSHDYILTPSQLQELAMLAKKAPCNWLKDGQDCPYGDSCCWGHQCPGGPKCYHLSKGKCWFKREFMH